MMKLRKQIDRFKIQKIVKFFVFIVVKDLEKIITSFGVQEELNPY